MFIDTHAHINHELLKDKKIDEIMKNEKFIICPSFDINSCKSTLDVCKKFKNVFGALAIHPSDVGDWNDETYNFLKINLKNEKIVAVGEYGLDYHYLPYDKHLQKQIMLSQLDLAKEEKLPSIFHIREAFDDFISIIKDNLTNFSGGVVHCFDGNLSDAKNCLDLGLLISFTGLVTHKKKDDLREVVKYVPVDRIMLETDSPYLAPEPFRGGVCVPDYVKKVYELVSRVKNIPLQDLEQIVEENVKNFFKKVKI